MNKINTWILVANASEAKIFKSENLRVGALEFVHELTHPENRQKVSDLKSGKQGHFKNDSGARGAYSGSDPKEVENEHFALELIHELKSGWDQNKYKQLVLIAPAHFYGLIKKHMHNHIVEFGHIPKDYTRYTTQQLVDSIKEHFFSLK